MSDLNDCGRRVFIRPLALTALLILTAAAFLALAPPAAALITQQVITSYDDDGTGGSEIRDSDSIDIPHSAATRC